MMLLYSSVGSGSLKPPNPQCLLPQSNPFRKFSFLSPTEDIHHLPQQRQDGHNAFPGFIKYIQEPICSCQRDTEGSLGVFLARQPPLNLPGRAFFYRHISMTGSAEGYPSSRAVDSLCNSHCRTTGGGSQGRVGRLTRSPCPSHCLLVPDRAWELGVCGNSISYWVTMAQAHREGLSPW